MRPRRRKVGEKQFTTHEALRRWCYTIYRSRAKVSGFNFTLTREEFNELIEARCHYCDDTPKNELRRPRIYGTAVLRYQGVDRKNNARGYTNDNVVPCCGRCNLIKGPNISFDEMEFIAVTLKKLRLPLALLLPQDLPELARERLALLLTILRQRAKASQ